MFPVLKNETDSNTAVTIRNGKKTFSGGNVDILRNFSMTVPRGSLYSLIGCSGCGKTTVLSTIVGVTSLDKGTVSVFESDNIPSQLCRIGYMPQEDALYNRFSILENFVLFGTLQYPGKASLRKEYLLERSRFLIKLLGLPSSSRVGTLSGGQRRRVSFGVALINEPDLLVLDEPLAGVDPLIRERIWNHLTYLVKTKAVTVILTTHSIEEARHSNIVGVLRDGQLIAELEPINLLEKLRVTSLESAFVELCKQKTRRNSLVNFVKLARRFSISSCVTYEESCDFTHSKRRIKELTRKNFVVLSRSHWMMAFMILVPAICMLTACITFSHQAHNIKLGLVNLELDDSAECSKIAEFCNIDKLSCDFINEIPNDIINLVDTPAFVNSRTNMNEAKEATQAGCTWGYIHFPRNYSDAVVNLQLEGVYETNISEHENEWNSSRITVHLDQTNTLVSAVIISTLYETFEKASIQSLIKCGLEERRAEFSLQYNKPIIGISGLTSLHYVGPSIAVALLYFFPVTVAIRFISERRQGTVERCQASGALLWEILASYFIAEFVVLSIQSLLVYLILHYGFNIGESPSLAPFNTFLILALCILQGLSGLTFGFILGVLCHDEAQAAMLIMATIFPNSFIAGLVWPVEGMPYILQKVSPLFPMTLPGEAIRSLMIRGWNILHPAVWSGFLVTAVYITIFSLLTIVIAGNRKK